MVIVFAACVVEDKDKLYYYMSKCCTKMNGIVKYKKIELTNNRFISRLKFDSMPLKYLEYKDDCLIEY